MSLISLYGGTVVGLSIVSQLGAKGTMMFPSAENRPWIHQRTWNCLKAQQLLWQPCHGWHLAGQPVKNNANLPERRQTPLFPATPRSRLPGITGNPLLRSPHSSPAPLPTPHPNQWNLNLSSWISHPEPCIPQLEPLNPTFLTLHHSPCILNPEHRILHPSPHIPHPKPLNPASLTPSPWTLHPSPCTPEPCTPNPASFTLNLASFTLHPSSLNTATLTPTLCAPAPPPGGRVLVPCFVCEGKGVQAATVLRAKRCTRRDSWGCTLIVIPTGYPYAAKNTYSQRNANLLPFFFFYWRQRGQTITVQ